MKIPVIPVNILVIASILLILVCPISVIGEELAGNANQSITTNASADMGLQTWSLHSRPIFGGYVMDLDNNPANRGTDQMVSIAGGAQALWIADKSVTADTEYSRGYWFSDIFTTVDWGTQGSACQIDVGILEGSVFTKFDMKLMSSVYFSTYPSSEIRQVRYQTISYIIHPGQYLAFQITNNSAMQYDVLTAERLSGSKISGVNQGTITLLTPAPAPAPTTLKAPTSPSTSAVPTPPAAKPTTTSAPAPAPSSRPIISSSVAVPTTAPAPYTPLWSGITNFSDKVNASNGTFNASVTALSDDNKAGVKIPAGVEGHNVPGSPVTTIKIVRINNPGGAPPVGANFLVGSYFYQFEPSGAQFSKPVQITLPFDPALGDFPYIAYWDTLASPRQWQSLAPPFTLNFKDNTITGNTTHFTYFTVLALAPISAATTPGVQTKTPEPASPAKSQPAANWGMIAGIIGAVVAVLLISIILIRRRKERLS